MAFSGNYTCTCFKTGLMNGLFDFSTEQFYIALYTNAATLTPSTTEYTSDGEVVANGYTAGGRALPLTVAPTTGPTGTIAYISFADVEWVGSFTARGAMIYKPGANGAVCVLDFGSDKTSTTTFTVQFPAATNTSAIIRIA
jgi:hypothetical protein